MLDIEATKSKEIYIHAELYRILQNVAKEPPPLLRFSSGSWTPSETLIEATIREDETSVKKADLVLMVKRTGSYGRVDRKPALVIEVKMRRYNRLSQSYGAFLKQAFKYAEKIDCYYYSVYDGRTFIYMQFGEPYLIGLSDYPLDSSETKKREFAERIWSAACLTASGVQQGILKDFVFHSDFDSWKKSVPKFIGQAYRRNAMRSGWAPTSESVNEASSQFARKWSELYESNT